MKYILSEKLNEEAGKKNFIMFLSEVAYYSNSFQSQKR